MTSRINEESQSVLAANPLASFNVSPTDETLIADSRWETHLPLQSTLDSKPNDVIEWRVAGAEEGAGYDLTSSFIQYKCQILQSKGLSSTVSPTLTLAEFDDSEQSLPNQVSPNPGWPYAGFHKRMAMSLNSVPVNTEFDNYNLVDYVDSLINRPKRDLKAEGWIMDRAIDESQNVSFTTVDRDPMAANGTASRAAANTFAVGVMGTMTLPSFQAEGLRVGQLINVTPLTVQGANAGDLLAAKAYFDKHNPLLVEQIGPRAGFDAANSPQDEGTRNVTLKLSRQVAGDVAPPALVMGGGGSHVMAIRVERVGGYPIRTNRRADRLQLSENAGALERRSKYLVGGQGSTSSAQNSNVPIFTFNWQPCVGAWKSGHYIPSDTMISLRATLNDHIRCFKDYNGAANIGQTAVGVTPRGQILQFQHGIKIVSAKMFLRRKVLNPNVDRALQSSFGSGGTVKINNHWLKLFSQRIEAQLSDVTLRSITPGPMARMYVVFTATDKVVNGSRLQRGTATTDLCWDHPFDISDSRGDDNASVTPAFPASGGDSDGGQDVKTMVLRINNQDYPTRQILQLTPSAGGMLEGGQKPPMDLGTIYEMYRNTVADSSDPALTLKEFQSTKLYCFSPELTADPSSVPPIVENADVSLRIELTKPTREPRQIFVLSYLDSCITINQQREVYSDY